MTLEKAAAAVGLLAAVLTLIVFARRGFSL